MLRKLIAPVYLNRAKAVRSLEDPAVLDEDPVSLAQRYSGLGADILLIFDQSDSDQEHDESLTLMRRMARVSDIPMWGAGNVKRVEDVKKILYAGCQKAVLNYAKRSNLEMLEEVSKRFGREKIAVCVKPSGGENPTEQELALIEQYAQDLILLEKDTDSADADAKKMEDRSFSVHVILNADSAQCTEEDGPWAGVLKGARIGGIGGAFTQDAGSDLMRRKAEMKAEGMEVILPESSFSWEDLNPSEQGLIPVVVQDYRNEEVLMVAYMNQEAYEATLRTGVMTYWSRSRRQLWVKGETSGHFQYLKELRVDCDNDTLLARVAQIGAACHTGNRSCFYRTALKKDTPQKNPMKVFEDVYATIEDRRQNPKEGSYTNYLFEKGIDKILKKCGEEAAEIIIAAKNPNPEEIKYEIADFLYHMMVLMSERGITWEDIAQELANRE